MGSVEYFRSSISVALRRSSFLIVDYFCCLLTAMAVFSLPALALLMSLMSQFGCDAKMVNFDDHYKAWAKRKAGELRRSLSWTDAYGKHKHLAERPEYRKLHRRKSHPCCTQDF